MYIYSKMRELWHNQLACINYEEHFYLYISKGTFLNKNISVNKKLKQNFFHFVTSQQPDNLFTGLFLFPQKRYKNWDNIKEYFKLNCLRVFSNPFTFEQVLAVREEHKKILVDVTMFPFNLIYFTGLHLVDLFATLLHSRKYLKTSCFLKSS